MKILDKSSPFLLVVLGGVMLVGCVFLGWLSSLLFNRPSQQGLIFQTPAQMSTEPSPTSPFELGMVATGTPGEVQPTPIFEQLAETATPQAVPTNLPAPAGLQGKIIYPHRFNSLNAIYQIELANNSSPAALLEPVSNLFLTACSVSPDGSKVAFNYLRGDMYVLEIGSSEPTRLGACGAPSWSPDGTQVVCKSSQEASFIILDAQTGGLVRTMAVDGGALFPTWSPAGDEIIYNTRDSQGNSSIWRMSLTGDSSPVLLEGEGGGENYVPAWSPDGQWIAFQSNMNGALSDIYVMDRKGDNVRRVVNTPPEFWSRAPAWSPDGQWLAFVSNQAGSIGQDYGEIFIVSLATGEVRQVTQTGGRVYDWRIAWGK